MQSAKFFECLFFPFICSLENYSRRISIKLHRFWFKWTRDTRWYSFWTKQFQTLQTHWTDCWKMWNNNNNALELNVSEWANLNIYQFVSSCSKLKHLRKFIFHFENVYFLGEWEYEDVYHKHTQIHVFTSALEIYAFVSHLHIIIQFHSLPLAMADYFFFSLAFSFHQVNHILHNRPELVSVFYMFHECIYYFWGRHNWA